jgi:hypothetical protein
MPDSQTHQSAGSGRSQDHRSSGAGSPDPPDGRATLERKDEDFICFYRDAVIAGHDYPAAETMRRFNLSHDLIVRVLNEAISGCEGQDIRNWKK